MFDSEALLVETGPLVLDPSVVQAAVLAALLGPEEGDPDLETPIVAVPRIVGVATRRCGKGLQHLTDSLAKTLATAADERRVMSSVAEAAAASGTSSGEGGTLGAGDDGGLTAARRFCGTWQAGTRHLYDAALVACREAAVQPLDWVPPGIEGRSHSCPLRAPLSPAPPLLPLLSCPLFASTSCLVQCFSQANLRASPLDVLVSPNVSMMD